MAVGSPARGPEVDEYFSVLLEAAGVGQGSLSVCQVLLGAQGFGNIPVCDPHLWLGLTPFVGCVYSRGKEKKRESGAIKQRQFKAVAALAVPDINQERGKGGEGMRP